MRKFLFILLTCLPIGVMAQHFGHIDYNAVLKLMPEYVEVQEYMVDLRTQYQAEMRRSEEEFNRKYNEFLDGQKNFPETILVKRQKELQGLFEAGLAFRAECEEQLKKAEENLLNTVNYSLQKAINEVAVDMELEYVLNTSERALLYVGPNGTDITEQVKAKLRIK